jgi:hypothetical protein
VGGAPDISSLTITTYSDGTVSFLVTLANRNLLHVNETAQLNIDLNDDGLADLDVGIWGNGNPSFLYRITASGWTTVRQLPELVQSNGSFSLRIGLSALRDAAGVSIGGIPAVGVDAAGRPLGPSIGVNVETFAYSGNQATLADSVPTDPAAFIQHELDPSASPPPTDTTSTTATATETPLPTINLGQTVLLKRRTRTSGCKLGALPDRRCSPGAYYSGLTRAVICSAGFRTSTIRNVPQSEKYAVEREYGLTARLYGRTLEIDHIVSLELGGSNDIANLYPEEATLPGHAPGYHVKDKLENKLHAMVCAGQISLRSAQRGIASNWEKLYRKVFGAAP